jgi:hypothetical protein
MAISHKASNWFLVAFRSAKAARINRNFRFSEKSQICRYFRGAKGGQGFSATATNGLVFALVVICLLGCGSGRRETLGKVSGRVTLRSAPAYPSVVTFANKEQGVHMTAIVAEDGQYTVKMARGDGLPLGTYQVAVIPGPGKAPAFKPGPPIRVDASQYPKIPKNYQDPNSSGLTLTVKEGDNVYDIEMK